MVARVDGLDGALVGVHRTWLHCDLRGQWHHRVRASLGPVAGGALRLAAAGEMLMVGEGIEMAMATMQATAQPVWAAGSTSGMALRLPQIVLTRSHFLAQRHSPSKGRPISCCPSGHPTRCSALKCTASYAVPR
jgi:hypothetical protein